MKSDREIATTAIEAVHVPDLAAQAAAACSNANLRQNPGVRLRKITEAFKKEKTPVIMIDDDVAMKMMAMTLMMLECPR